VGGTAFLRSLPLTEILTSFETKFQVFLNFDNYTSKGRAFKTHKGKSKKESINKKVE